MLRSRVVNISSFHSLDGVEHLVDSVINVKFHFANGFCCKKHVQD